ncbi:class E sortase [Rubrobacter aplysinae]|uniref:class E sortase n=1 Tax=Rubrobacter aplysinae TaxID=909625 RepID=UPI00064C0F18|nr:class E sortase [Rubrobacter aplysinae]
MTRFANTRSRAAIAALLLSFFILLASACGGSDQGSSEGAQGSQQGQDSAPETTNSGKEVEAVEPEDVLSEKERTGFQEPEAWGKETGSEVKQIQTGTSAGAVPAVKPFNFGRDPGGPQDKTLYLTIPKLGLESVPAFDSTTEEKLKQGVIHVPATGFPWQQGANTYIAGHRIGYPGTRSDKIFYDLDQLAAGDEVTVADAAGSEYVYRITSKDVVGSDNVQVMNPPEGGGSILTLQTCTLPDYKERIVVQGELIQGDTTAS